jgi:glycosyltransferase involved in cell wall biosynthesis
MKFVIFAQHMPDPCGAFFHDIALAKELSRRGHTVNFVTTQRAQMPIRGVYRGLNWVYYTNAENELRGASVWMSPHFPFLKLVRRLNERFQKPLVVTMHFGENTESVLNYSRTGEWAEFLWVVSKHICEYVKTSIPLSPSFKTIEDVRPIMLEDEIKFNDRGNLPTGDCITLINANIMKGLPLFLELASRFPDKKFLGVRPYYNVVKVPEKLTNIEWINIQDDIRTILRRTRILLVPSKYESWGRVAFEAMYNGIPVLYSKPMDDSNPEKRSSGTTEGMEEWIADSQFKCDYFNIDEWIDVIHGLDDPTTYKIYSDKAFERTYTMDVFNDAAPLERKLVDYGVQFAPKVQTTPQTAASALSSGIPTLRMPPPSGAAAAGSGRPFRGGRFVVRR